MFSRRGESENGLGWVLLEVLAALAIAIGIVWWTIPKKPKKREDNR
jgi:hypothetical protein